MEVLSIKIFFKTIHRMAICVNVALHELVLNFFKSLNRTVKSKLRVWYMKNETSEHFHSLTKVFKWLVLPFSLFYACTVFYYFGRNPLNSLFWGILIFLYSNFLPDLPSSYINRKNNSETEPLQWYKKYTLLLLAPIFVWLLFSGIRLKWKTTETFHNFKSLAIYTVFLVVFGFFIFGDCPISMGNIPKILSLPIYGFIGYMTHLKVDKIWGKSIFNLPLVLKLRVDEFNKIVTKTLRQDKQRRK